MVDLSPWIHANLTVARGWLQCAIDGAASRDDLLDAEASIQRANAELGDALPMSWLGSRMRLTVTERRVLWLAIAHELCPVARTMLRSLSTEALSDPTTDVLRRTAYKPEETRQAWTELAANAPLRRWRLLERTDGSADAPAHRQTWRAADRVLALVHGETCPDPELLALGSSPAAPTGIGGHGIEVCRDAEARITAAVEAARSARSGLVIVQGPSGTGRRSLLASIISDPLVVEARMLGKDQETAQRQLRALHRESRLLDRPLLVRDLDEASAHLDLVERELAGLVVLATAKEPIARRWAHPPRTIELPPLSGAQRAQLWSRALPSLSTADADRLATLYPIAPAMIAAAAAYALEQARDTPLERTQIVEGLRAVLDDHFAGLAQRVVARQKLADLVLSQEQAEALGALLARIRERRRVYEDWNFGAKVGRAVGVAALFSGPPGTGKTMAATLLARELGLEIYQVDASKIVSKWIGETEKNLSALFDAAEAGQAILLFDEADALFGKRTDVKSSNDRHANQETNFLLQRIESFTGICILTSNHEDSLDEAFQRRLSAHVRFSIPDFAERAQLWRTLVPEEAPIASDIDYRTLASCYEMSGGYIRNAVLRAAFQAASVGSEITSEHLLDAAAREYEAIGRLAGAIH